MWTGCGHCGFPQRIRRKHRQRRLPTLCSRSTLRPWRSRPELHLGLLSDAGVGRDGAATVPSPRSRRRTRSSCAGFGLGDRALASVPRLPRPPACLASAGSCQASTVRRRADVAACFVLALRPQDQRTHVLANRRPGRCRADGSVSAVSRPRRRRVVSGRETGRRRGTRGRRRRDLRRRDAVGPADGDTERAALPPRDLDRVREP